MIKVRLFASLRELPGAEDFEIPPEGIQPHTVEALFEMAAARIPSLRQRRDRILVAVNQNHSNWSTVICDGDEVAFFPPVSGGCR